MQFSADLVTFTEDVCNRNLQLLCSDLSALIFFSPGDCHTKGLLVLFHLGLEVVIEVEIDPKGRLVSFRVALFNERVLCVYATSGYSTREQLDRGRFFEGLQNYMENKYKGNENKIILLKALIVL